MTFAGLIGPQPLAVPVPSLYNDQDAGINRLHLSIAGNRDRFPEMTAAMQVRRLAAEVAVAADR